MGYTITIGELDIIKSPNDGIDCSCIFFDTKEERHDDAPALIEVSDSTNSRYPTCTDWYNFIERLGLTSVFYDRFGLIGGYPGVRLVTSELVEIVGCSKRDFEKKITNPKIDYDYNRLIWLDYWLNWAFKNCKTPVIVTF